MNKAKNQGNSKIFSILIGPLAFFLAMFALESTFGHTGACAIGMTVWIVTWWITRPVNIAITALLPVVVNGIFNLIPMETVTSQYASEIIVLLFGADLVCMTWSRTGLDKRLSLKMLCLVGPSMKQQIAVWLLAPRILSLFLPDAVVCILVTPVAISMLQFVGEKDISKSKMAVPILLAIAWGSGIGGAGSPLGGAMNLVAISAMETYTGQEFMYIDWVIRMLPFLLVMLMIILAYLLFFVKTPSNTLGGTKEYFAQEYKALGKMKRGEILSLTVFAVSTILAFARPLFADSLPGLKPAYCFLIMGILAFFLRDEKNEPLLTWEHASKKTMLGMLFLFGGGLAIGELLTGTGATDVLAEMISQFNLTGGIGTIAIFVVFASLLAEMTSNTAAAAISMPVVMAITQKLGLNPVPYWFITSMAFNCAYVLPLTVRAVPVGFGLDVNHLLKKGLPLAVISMVSITIVGYLFMTFWPTFSILPY